METAEEPRQLRKFRGFCIGHRPPAIPLWPGFTFVCGRDCGVPGAWNYLEEFPDLAFAGQTSEYPALFAIRRRLERKGFEGTVVVTQYRRLVARTQLGQPAANMDRVHMISAAAAAGIPLAQLLPRTGQSWLMAAPVPLQVTSAEYYRHAHVGRDLLRFLADAIDADALTHGEAWALMSARHLMVAPGVGAYPAAHFIATFRRLELAAEAFCRGGHIPREGYQGRTLGFCLERANGVLATAALARDRATHPLSRGYQVVVSEDGCYRTG